MPTSPEPGIDLCDVQIAFCKVFGMTNLETCKSVATPEYPLGCSERTVTNRMVKGRPFIEMLVKWGAAIRRDRQLDIKEIAAGQVRAELTKELGSAVAQIKIAIKEGDTDSAWRLLEHLELGRPTQAHTLTGDVTVNHMIWQPERLLLQQEQDMAKARDFLGDNLPEGVIEGELVEPT